MKLVSPTKERIPPKLLKILLPETIYTLQMSFLFTGSIVSTTIKTITSKGDETIFHQKVNLKGDPTWDYGIAIDNLVELKINVDIKKKELWRKK